MFEITNIFERISTSILDKQRNEMANLTKYVHAMRLHAMHAMRMQYVHVHFRLIFQSQNIDYFTPNRK